MQHEIPHSSRAALAAAGLCLILLWCAAGLAAAPPQSSRQEEAASANGSAGRKYPPRIYETIRRQGPPPVIDGRLDDEAWKEGAWAGDYTQQMPSEGAPPSQPTEIKILYDDRSIYVAMRVFDDPALVHRYPGRRDDLTGDMVGICFDSYNSKRTGFEFDITAGGSKIDLVLGNGEMEWDTTWDAVWDGAVAHHDRGWNAEFRIPLNQLRFSGQEEQVWGMHAWRWISRLQEESQWQLIPRQNSGRMHQLGELHGIRRLPRPRHLELLPHVVARSEPDRSDGGGTAGSASAGLDIKVGITSNFTLDATVNPDFGQVEADPSVINLTAYETFYEEKRPFFLEGRKILDFQLEGFDQLFYSRRIGQAPSAEPSLAPGESARIPESTTILGAAKLTGRTENGLSVGVLQSVTAGEFAEITSPDGRREQRVEPMAGHTVARIHKDWNNGNTSLGGMVTEAFRPTSDPALAVLPDSALTAGVDFTRYFDNRLWLLEASSVFSRVDGDREAIHALQTNPVHFFQRPDAGHLGVRPGATSLAGHGGSVRFGRSESSRLRLTDHFHWYSPGLDLNHLGFLRQADLAANQIFLGWSETEPKGIFRQYSAVYVREDEWDFGGLKTKSANRLEAEARFKNKWGIMGNFEFQQSVDTRALRGGPALRLHDAWDLQLEARTDSSRRIFLGVSGKHTRAFGDSSRVSRLESWARFRPSNRFTFALLPSFDRLANNLQYAATAASAGSPRWLLGRIDQQTWNFTMRANLVLTPDLTIQYYGSPFFSNGRYSDFKRTTNPLAERYADRFHALSPAEISYLPTANGYRVQEKSDPAPYTFDNPDFSFRQFRSNLVLRWEYRPGSTFYAVWSQGRTAFAPRWQSGFSSNWDALWRDRPENVFLVKMTFWLSP